MGEITQKIAFPDFFEDFMESVILSVICCSSSGITETSDPCIISCSAIWWIWTTLMWVGIKTDPGLFWYWCKMKLTWLVEQPRKTCTFWQNTYYTIGSKQTQPCQCTFWRMTEAVYFLSMNNNCSLVDNKCSLVVVGFATSRAILSITPSSQAQIRLWSDTGVKCERFLI